MIFFWGMLWSSFLVNFQIFCHFSCTTHFLCGRSYQKIPYTEKGLLEIIMFQQQNCLNIWQSFATKHLWSHPWKISHIAKKIEKSWQKISVEFTLHTVQVGSWGGLRPRLVFYFNLANWVENLVLKVNLRNQLVHPPSFWKVSIVMDIESDSKWQKETLSKFLGRQGTFLLAFVLTKVF
jgi:hypothetical protein